MEDDKKDDFAARVKAMTSEERKEAARQLLDGARRYLAEDDPEEPTVIEGEASEVHVGSGGTRKRDV